MPRSKLKCFNLKTMALEGSVIVSLYNYSIAQSVRAEFSIGVYEQNGSKPVLVQSSKEFPVYRRFCPTCISIRRVLDGSYTKFFIDPNFFLSNGKLIIHSPKWLLNKVFFIKLPCNERLNRGLRVTLFHPIYSKTQINFYQPEKEKLAHLTIAVNNKVVPHQKELITMKIGSTSPPVVTMVPNSENFFFHVLQENF